MNLDKRRWGILIASCLTNLCIGSGYSRSHNSVNYGIMFIGFGLSGLFGPIVMNNIYRACGAYQRTFLTAALLVAVGLALTFLFRTFVRRRA